MSIQYKFFTVSIGNHQEEELNTFLRSHKVVMVHREFVANEESSFWSFAVEYLEVSPANNKRSSDGAEKKRIDYKEVLSPEDFAVFAGLREWRKHAAGEAGVPVYTIFTNEQLATIITNRAHSKSDMRGIEGIGDARVEKYGDAILQFMRELTSPTVGNE